VAANTDPGCPVADRDRDHVLDDVDACPHKKEDADDHRDEDGCPDPDNDNDGIPDRQDRCPNKPGPRNRRGCPAVLVSPPSTPVTNAPESSATESTVPASAAPEQTPAEPTVPR
jgi:hypothetical protein